MPRNITVTVRFGVSNELSKAVSENTTVGQLVNDRNIQATLGFGANVQAVIDGTVQPDNAPLSDGDVITVETKANTKAA